ncbi:AMP-binding protein [Lentimicrobium sp. S6]|uniref:AMP-binding protein n=1 Tax=Lentimicrobium sp. S6 TaxID=2735872 RepID=UPI0015572279|nr:AMP-binding protein [Lentimicrobium sp. S6]NPD45612.1 AMP-binding protein [Lentimicrobium sp. S6]
MHELPVLTLPALLQQSVKRFTDRPALAFVGKDPISYRQFDKKRLAVNSLLEKLKIQAGDRVALLSTNMPNWGITYFAIASMGAVVVPILPDFSEYEIDNILTHSEAKAIFVSNGLKAKIKNFQKETLLHRILIEDYSILESDRPKVRFKEASIPKRKHTIVEEDLAVIIYTSGTTGKSKGVMLTHKNIVSNAVSSGGIQEINPFDRFLSVLPLSHTYENTIGFILPILRGACVYYITRPPTPAVLLPALKEVRPTLMLTVPLIIEKVYKSKVLPSFNKNKLTRALYAMPFSRKKMNLLAGKKLMQTFGGELKFFGIGGAKLDKTVEIFLREAKFPYAIGYGLTETAPLLAGANPKHTKLQSTGPKLEGVSLKINNPGKLTGEGEIWAKGPNVMKGYYKEPELTKEVLSEDGWFKTGDLGIIDKTNHLYIRGRSKNVIIGPGGENIFPEDIESIINNFKHVAESLVIQQKGKLVAMVHFNREEIEEKYKNVREEIEAKFEDLSKELQEYVNARVNKFSKIQIVEPHKEEFTKTATQKIKRFLYQRVPV